MSSFRYSFQRVVDLKSSEKTQAEWILSSAIGALTEEEISLEQLQLKKRDWEEKLISAASTAVPLSELQIIQQYLDYLVTCIASKMKDVLRAQKAVDQSRLKLSDKMKDEKVWLKAKDHARDRFQYALQIKEQNELDELASVRFMISTP
ncbi:flagellar export protein FliJ [Paenibacillus sp. FSL H8-0548]|uniref:flagellar export protein FliJ n=1 Tax=Paenibacillus sp. FSL H8-0548 TaxID=1920422 RepID=UPI00096E5FBF|nr:flagellar export protein FliJ [Paenibacillus sp. FSL H8-0548]OMF36807.1 flagellar export protein FliJ [Paenibacillus sp. FSL H8-0548]